MQLCRGDTPKQWQTCTPAEGARKPDQTSVHSETDSRRLEGTEQHAKAFHPFHTQRILASDNHGRAESRRTIVTLRAAPRPPPPPPPKPSAGSPQYRKAPQSAAQTKAPKPTAPETEQTFPQKSPPGNRGNASQKRLPLAQRF